MLVNDRGTRIAETWRDAFVLEAEKHGETEANIIHLAATPDFGWDEPDYLNGAGSHRKERYTPRFTIWTTTRIYFPVTYDGHTRLRSLPRHPCEEMTDAFGGG